MYIKCKNEKLSATLQHESRAMAFWTENPRLDTSVLVFRHLKNPNWG